MDEQGYDIFFACSKSRSHFSEYEKSENGMNFTENREITTTRRTPYETILRSHHPLMSPSWVFGSCFTRENTESYGTRDRRGENEWIKIRLRTMGVPDVEQAKKRLQDILRRAQKLEIPTQEVISTRTARKLLARTRNVLAWTIWIGVFIVLLSGVVYARWPTRQDVETVRTVLRRTVSIDISIFLIFWILNNITLYP